MRPIPLRPAPPLAAEPAERARLEASHRREGRDVPRSSKASEKRYITVDYFSPTRMTGLSAYTPTPVPGASLTPEPTAAAAAAPPSSGRPTRAYLLKDVDHFAGFAHAISTYIAGVALADLHDLNLLYYPFKVAHGSGHVWDDFFAADPRGLVPPLAAPVLTVSNESGMQIDGTPARLTQILSRHPKEDISQRVNATLATVKPNQFVWLRKGRSTFPPCTGTGGCEVLAETQYAGLWLRERFWQAVHGRIGGGRAATATTDTAAPAAPAVPAVPAAQAAQAAAPNVSIAIHVRRGDVTWLDRYASSPSYFLW